MTPIADSLRLAAEQIPRTAEAVDIILVTDGLETCEGDPCQVAARLAEQGLAIRAHVVGFGLTDSEIQQLSCVTEQTGGELFQTNSGAELARALSQVEQAAAEPVPESEPEPAPPPAAKISVPDEAPAGSVIEVAWMGPDNDNDYITIVEAGAPEGSHTDYVRTQRGSPVTLDAPEAPGDYEVRYVLQQSGRTLASVPVSVGAGEVSLAIEGTPEAGGVVTVSWQGPGRYEDFIQIVEASSPTAAEAIREARASQGSPLQLFAPSAAGDYEVRYKASDSGEILKRITFSVD